MCFDVFVLSGSFQNLVWCSVTNAYNGISLSTNQNTDLTYICPFLRALLVASFFRAATCSVFQFKKLTSVFHASVLVLIMNFVITLSRE